MSYYEVEFKLKLVKEYLEGPLGGRALAKKYGLPSNALIYNWKHSYQLFGKEGLKRHRPLTKYTSEFKRDVLHFIETTDASFGEAARQFKLPNGSMISRWQRKYIAGGQTALSNQKGRPKKRMNKPTKKQQETSKLSREKELERENERLRIEVEYLKKLRTFQQTIMAKRKDEFKPE
ncbi:helix-turn-helix domain-containing protein [Enterococcus ureilyticus]|uniref:helix-turn-helix domain-containing protein n=1 Tax=Enterococcus ureilyticus TaxID=1131292 RepID=UPI0012FD5420|nr:helix-turn-helix domain-containing protein [Enterococcus ureilyticus]